jgi:hypothetical protein
MDLRGVYCTLEACARGIIGLGKVLIWSHLPDKRMRAVIKERTKGNCIVLLNGPSLKDSIGTVERVERAKYEFCCTNEFAVDDYYGILRPRLYVLMDRLYWDDSLTQQSIERRTRTFRAIQRNSKWEVNVFLPFAARRSSHASILAENAMVRVIYYDLTSLVGCPKVLREFFYRRNMALPCALNVLIPCLIVLVNAGFRQIYCVGADHSWHESIGVTDENQLYIRENYSRSNQGSEQKILWSGYGDACANRVSSFFGELHLIFKSYDEIQRFSTRFGSSIYNASARSYIDAFARVRLEG